MSGPHEIVAAVTRPDKPSGRGKRMQTCAVKAMALERGIEVLDPSSPKDPAFAERLAELAPDLGVCVAYGRIIPMNVLELPRLGIINAHGSLLPRLRGAAPIERAILEGEKETGVTIMYTDEIMDTGDIFFFEKVEITADTTGGELRERMAELSAGMLVEAVKRLARGQAERTPQDDSLATNAPPLAKEEAAIDWAASSEDVDRRVRAFAPKPGAFTFDGDRRLKILAGRPLADAQVAGEPGCIGETTGEGFTVACSRGAFLVTAVQPEGRKAMDADAYMRGCRDADPHRRLHG